MMEKDKKILIYAYGNPGRQDDGLGNAVIELMEVWKQKKQLDYLYLDANYQLNVEDATEMHDKDLVIFIDASMEDDIGEYGITKVYPSDKLEFSMHATSPGYIVYLSEHIYGCSPPTYLMHIKGYEWVFNEPMTKKAEQNLYKALNCLKDIVIHQNIAELESC